MTRAYGKLAEQLPNDNCQEDTDLATIIAAWPALPEAVKAGILALVSAAAREATRS